MSPVFYCHQQVVGTKVGDIAINKYIPGWELSIVTKIAETGSVKSVNLTLSVRYIKGKDILCIS